MTKVEYRLIGNTANPTLTKEFNTRSEADTWIKEQGNILVLVIESTGAAAMSRIFGGC